MAAVDPPRPLEPSDDRDHFDCGRDSLNMWFRRHRSTITLAVFRALAFLVDSSDGRIAGFVSLSAAQVERGFLPKPQQRNRPDPIPATLLGQLAVDKAYQAQGHAASLLIFALKTALRASDAIGSIGVITHPLDDTVRALYRKWGFEDLPFDPGHAMMVRMDDLRRAFGA
ncbi:MAG: GNAT family N-acetyltransferase [Rhizobiales bacterium]|nr:GNAT family N-acetyltransferase [Hyphomicrobiales bacterium]